MQFVVARVKLVNKCIQENSFRTVYGSGIFIVIIFTLFQYLEIW